jgi:hypothetical protein
VCVTTRDAFTLLPTQDTPTSASRHLSIQVGQLIRFCVPLPTHEREASDHFCMNYKLATQGQSRRAKYIIRDLFGEVRISRCESLKTRLVSPAPRAKKYCFTAQTPEAILKRLGAGVD